MDIRRIESGKRDFLPLLLLGDEQAEVEQLVRRLNQRQIPIQEAEERFLNGEDLLPVL